MQACIYEEYGPPEVVKLGEVETPKVKADEVLVRVRATSVTTADWRFRASAFPGVFWLPGRVMLGLFRPRNAILGVDFSGVVEATGVNKGTVHGWLERGLIQGEHTGRSMLWRIALTEDRIRSLRERARPPSRLNPSAFCDTSSNREA